MRTLVPAAFLCLVVSVACADEGGGDAVLGSSAALANADRQFVPGAVRGHPLLDKERGFVPGTVRGQPMVVGSDAVALDDCVKDIEAALDSSDISDSEQTWLRDFLASAGDREAACEVVWRSLQELE